jgi:hypothetical protein
MQLPPLPSRRRRAIRQALGPALAFNDVATEQQLRAQIAAAAIDGRPRGIRVTQTIGLTERLLIPAAATGLVIEGVPGIELVCSFAGTAIEVEGFPFEMRGLRITSPEVRTQRALVAEPVLTKYAAEQVIILRDVVIDGFQGGISISASGTGILHYVVENLTMTGGDLETFDVALGNGNARGSVSALRPGNTITESIDMTVGSSWGYYEEIDLGTNGTIAISGTRNTFNGVQCPGGMSSTGVEGYFMNIDNPTSPSGTDVIVGAGGGGGGLTHPQVLARGLGA